MQDKTKRFHKWLEEPEQEKRWDDFCKAAGFPNKKKRAKNLKENLETIERWRIKQILKRMKKKR